MKWKLASCSGLLIDSVGILVAKPLEWRIDGKRSWR